MANEQPSRDTRQGGEPAPRPFNPFLWAAVAVGLLFLILALLVIW